MIKSYLFKFINLALFFTLFFGVFIAIGAQLSPPVLKTLDNAGIVFSYLLTCLSVAGAIYAVFHRYQIRKWLFRQTFENLGDSFDVAPTAIQAIIIPVSRREQPEWILRWLQPRHVAFLYTEHSKTVTEELTREFEEHVEFLHPPEAIAKNKDCLQDPYNPEKAYELAKNLIQHFINRGISPGNIFVDTTGGTVPMSVGAFQAAESTGVSSIYIVGKEKGFIKNPEKQHHGFPIFLSDHTQSAA
ncbi:MAG: hypothetical protein KDI06_14010 [Calditrichaeota bacterium]|nr:hypothetical protein [Calditrichota bacterium]HQU73026.1 hypothetical protein [Calditrichia bacterium]